MSPITTQDDDRLTMRSGGSGCVLLLGVPFLLVGLGIMVVPLFGEPGLSEGVPKALIVTVPFGLVFCGIGALLLLLRCVFEIDRDGGTVTRTWRMVVPFHTATRRLEDFDRVALISEEVESGGHTTVTYQVRLEGSGEAFALSQDSRYAPERLVAERVARFLQFDLHDYAHGEVVVRGAGELDQSLGERIRRAGLPVRVPILPEDSTLAFFVRDETLHVSLPRRKLGRHGRWAMIVFFALWVIPGSALVWISAARSGWEGLGLVLPGLLWGVLVFVPLLCMLWGLYKNISMRRTLVVSPEGLELRRTYFPMGTRTRRIPADELEELERNEECLTARSDTESIDFGFDLSEGEREWLEAAVRAILAAGQ